MPSLVSQAPVTPDVLDAKSALSKRAYCIVSLFFFFFYACLQLFKGQPKLVSRWSYMGEVTQADMSQGRLD